jgi:four helix bundle protein
MKVHSYKDLIVWQKSLELIVLVYKITEAFPKNEVYGVVSQMRRAAVSISSNIAEGWARANAGEFIQFLYISYGSACELETQLIVSKKLKFGKMTEYKIIENLLLEVQKMTFTMIKKLKSKKLVANSYQLKAIP